MAPMKWDETSKVRLLLAVIEAGDEVGRWDIVAQKMGGGVSGDAVK
jgi:hypothetical protein